MVQCDRPVQSIIFTAMARNGIATIWPVYKHTHCSLADDIYTHVIVVTNCITHTSLFYITKTLVTQRTFSTSLVMQKIIEKKHNFGHMFILFLSYSQTVGFK